MILICRAIDLFFLDRFVWPITKLHVFIVLDYDTNTHPLNTRRPSTIVSLIQTLNTAFIGLLTFDPSSSYLIFICSSCWFSQFSLNSDIRSVHFKNDFFKSGDCEYTPQ